MRLGISGGLAALTIALISLPGPAAVPGGLLFWRLEIP